MEIAYLFVPSLAYAGAHMKWRAAPVTMVVGLLAQIVFYVVTVVLVIAVPDVLERRWQTIFFGIDTSVALWLAVAGFELAWRGRGRIRAGGAVAGASQVLVAGSWVFLSIMMRREKLDDLAWLEWLDWAVPLAWLGSAIGFTVAAGARYLAVGLATAIAASVLRPLPPVQHLLARSLREGEYIYYVFAGLIAGYSLALIVLAGGAASQLDPRPRSPGRAARALRMASLGCVAAVAGTLAIGLVDDPGQLAVNSTFLLNAAAAAWSSAWLSRLAGSALERLPRYSIQLGAAVALWVAIVHARQTSWLGDFSFGGRAGFSPLVTGSMLPIGIAIALAALARYARGRQPARARLFALGAALIAALSVASWWVDTPLVAAGIVGAACVLAAAGLRVAAALAERDTVSATADVFA